MDNPLISPWMQNTAVSVAANGTAGTPANPMRFPATAGPLADRAMLYQQYAALASRNFGVKPAALYGGFNVNSLIPTLGSNAAANRLLMSNANGQVGGSPNVSTSEAVAASFNPSSLRTDGSNKLAAAQLIWKVCQRAQEQVN